jgi:hypothetical protein
MSNENLPAIWADNIGTGYEDEKERGPSVPRISIAQPLSPEISEGDEKYIPNLKSGDFFLSNGEKSRVIGKSAKFIFLHSIDRVTKWKYKDETRKKQIFVDQISVDEFDSLGIQKNKAGKYIESNESGVFVYTRSKNFFVLNYDAKGDGIQLLSFKGTGFFPALQMVKKFKSKIVSGKSLPMFAFIWELKTKRYDNDSGFHYGIGKDDEELLMTEVAPVSGEWIQIVTKARQEVDHILNNTVTAEATTEDVPF